MKLFFNYSIDCELPLNTEYTGGTEREPFFGGPADWDVAERSVRGFIEVMDRLGMRAGATLFVYPDVAQKQRHLFREMAEAGIEVALHLNGLRYSRLKGERAKWLGAMGRDEQLEAIRMAKADLEEAIGMACLGYRACYASANSDTFPICQELGFKWTSTSAAGSYQPHVHARWGYAWRFPYHPSRLNMRVPGDLEIYEMPNTRGFRTLLGGNWNRPLDLRAETPPETAGRGHAAFRQILIENLDEMGKCDQPVRGIFPASHNTNPFADASSHQHGNLVAVCRMTEEIARERGYAFTPSSFLEIRKEADRIGAF